MLEYSYNEDLIKNLCLQQRKEHVTSTSLKLRQCIREILPTLPWCCIILTNLRRTTIMSSCFPSFLLLLSYIPCPISTLSTLLVSFWLQNTLFTFRNASPASEQTTIPSNCFSLHQDQPRLPICISFSIMCIHMYLLSAMQALSFILHLVRVIAVNSCIYSCLNLLLQ